MSRLWAISAGQWDAHAVQALAQREVGAIFDRLKEHYDFIIVDSSPVLTVADALSLGQYVDGVIFSVLRDVSQLPAVRAAYQRLASVGCHMLGTVFTGARGETLEFDTPYRLTASR
jgi:Mrp family chromosome partitioning ATPase